MTLFSMTPSTLQEMGSHANEACLVRAGRRRVQSLEKFPMHRALLQRAGVARHRGWFEFVLLAVEPYLPDVTRSCSVQVQSSHLHPSSPSSRPQIRTSGSWDVEIRSVGLLLALSWTCSDPLLALYWPSAGLLLALCWPCSDPLLALYWPSAASVLHICWPCSDPLQAFCWPSAGPVFAHCWPCSGPVLALFRPCSGPRLALSWPSAGPVLALFWPSAGPLLALCWPCSGPVLVLYWPCSGPVLALCWPSAGPVLALFWPCSGPVLALCWPSAGPVLALFWPSAGPVLALFWPCSGPEPLVLQLHSRDILIWARSTASNVQHSLFDLYPASLVEGLSNYGNQGPGKSCPD
ncbi:unnamed protein product [Gadus morhua 'NCC']